MTAKTLDEFWGINEDEDDYVNLEEDESEPDLTDYKAFEQVLSLTSNDARQQFIRDLLNTTTEMQKEQAERLRFNNGQITVDNKPPWLKNTSRPGSESIHDHFLKYKEATQSNTKLVNNSKKIVNGNKAITERPLTRGGFFDDVVTQLFEGNNDIKYDDLDLTCVKEVPDPEFDKNSNTRRNIFEENPNNDIDDDIINIRKPSNFIGSITTTAILKQTPTNNKNMFKNIPKTTISNAITSMQNNECRQNFRNLQNRQMTENSMVVTGMENHKTRIPPHLFNSTAVSTQGSQRPASPPQRQLRPIDLFTRMSFGHDQTERDIIFQNSDEEDDYGEE